MQPLQLTQQRLRGAIAPYAKGRVNPHYYHP